MAIIYQEDFSPGTSVFDTMYLYQQDIDGVDPLYPFIEYAEGVYLNGDGFLDHDPAYTGEFETYQQAGIWIKGAGPSNGGGPGVYGGPGFWNGTTGWIEALYHPTTLSLTELTEPFVTAPTVQVMNPNGFTLIAVNFQLEDALLMVTHENEGSHDITVSVPGAPMPVAGEPFLVRVAWQCGTWDAGPGEALPDGYVRVYINETLAYEAIDISLFLAAVTVPVNMIDGAAFGYFGLLGPLEYFLINDEAYVVAEALQFRSGGTEYPLFFSTITFKDTSS